MFVIVAIGMAAALSAQEPTATGQLKMINCNACHGPVGNTAVPEWPKVAGLDEAYIVAQLRAYQAGARPSVLMAPHTRGLSEQEMHELGSVYASRKMSIGKPAGSDNGLAAQGARIYRSGIPGQQVSACATCHGPTGDGNPSKGFTRVGGQNAAYVVMQLQAFRSGQRVDPTQTMGRVTAQMSDDDMRAVAAYIQGLSTP